MRSARRANRPENLQMRPRKPPKNISAIEEKICTVEYSCCKEETWWGWAVPWWGLLNLFLGLRNNNSGPGNKEQGEWRFAGPSAGPSVKKNWISKRTGQGAQSDFRPEQGAANPAAFCRGEFDLRRRRRYGCR